MRWLIFICVWSLCVTVNAQHTTESKNEKELRQLLKEFQAENLKKEARVIAYLTSKGLDNRDFELDGNRYSIIDIENGSPVYYVTHNLGAVRAVEADELWAGGRFGLDLAGENINIGVWDRGLPLVSHREYQNRLILSDAASEFSDHSTHVTGTIIAGGVEPAAKGFCYRAEARAFDWFQDTEEMIMEVLNEDMMVSNHSYGIPGGWQGGMWFGNLGISDKEDYRFGFYDDEARAYDQIAYNAPYYAIFVSAGNERGDSGDGSIPPDGPYDCITGFSTAKNVITVGAVNKLTEYTVPSDVVMSSFSSWGPTDDGRIKPDIVAPGVNIFSSVSGSANNNYGVLSGTSMSSPATAGASALINQAYFQFNNEFMKAATLKGLIIHTARESGDAPGPDYEFGWGMLDAEAAVEQIVSADGVNRLILEENLSQGEIFEVELNPVLNEKITATLVWSDVAGVPVEPSLDPADLMLVNDLDLVIVDESGNEVLPWTLDPSAPMNAAVRGNNFRDNVEKIEFEDPQPRRYFLRVSHKGNLVNGSQDFSLILDYTSEDEGVQSFYWINDDGVWSDSSQWSSVSGGSPILDVPDENSKLIFDDNSFPDGQSEILMDRDFTVAGIVALNSRDMTMNLGGNVLTITGNTLLSSPNFMVRNGTIVFTHPDPGKSFSIDLDETLSENLTLIIDGANQAEWIMEEDVFAAEDFLFKGGQITWTDCDFLFDILEMTPSSSGSWRVSGTEISIKEALNINELLEIVIPDLSLNEISVEDTVNVMINVEQDMPNIAINVLRANADIDIDGVFPLLNLQMANIRLKDKLHTGTLEAEETNTIRFESGDTLFIGIPIIETSVADTFYLVGPANGRAAFNLSGRSRYCFNNFNINSVDLTGASVVSTGENSVIINSDGWFDGPCNNLLFADYESDYLCAGALARFEDTSEGDVTARDWYVDGVPVFGEDYMEFYFESEGFYEVALVVTDSEGNTNSLSMELVVGPNVIEENQIIQNQTQLASLKLAQSYQWYNYGVPIPGATGRVYVYNGQPGIYWVLTYDGDCNRRSEILDLGTAVVDADKSGIDLEISPNPFDSRIRIKLPESWNNEVNLEVYNIMGGRHLQQSIEGTTKEPIIMDTSHWSSGMYILAIRYKQDTFIKRIHKYE